MRRLASARVSRYASGGGKMPFEILIHTDDVAQRGFCDPHMQEPLFREAFPSYTSVSKNTVFCDIARLSYPFGLYGGSWVVDCGLR